MSKRRFRKQKLPAEPVDLEITSISHEGRGLAHREGKVAFVDGALKGERVSAQWLRKRSSFDEFKTLSVENPAQDRVVPECVFTSQCGGCSLQHWHWESQIAFKQSVLVELLEKTAGLSSGSYDVIPALLGNTTSYRRKARLGVRLVEKKGGVLVGFREKYSSFITEMDFCSILIPEVATLIKPLRELIGSLDGKRIIPQIEVAAGDKSADEMDTNHVALVFRHLEALTDSDQKCLIDFATAHQFDIYLQSGGIDTVTKLAPQDGRDRLHYFLPEFGLQLDFHPMDFTQINAVINRKIVNQALGYLDLQATDKVLDLFCGLGNFTLALASQCQSVVGVEGSEEMVNRGYENAAINKLANVEFYAANLTQSMKEKPWYGQTFDKILIDPPRSGALEIISEIAELRAKKIVYVSCNPATLARDTAALVEHGYHLTTAGVMDMFPHTTHVESMAVFELNS